MGIDMQLDLATLLTSPKTVLPKTSINALPEVMVKLDGEPETPPEFAILVEEDLQISDVTPLLQSEKPNVVLAPPLIGIEVETPAIQGFQLPETVPLLPTEPKMSSSEQIAAPPQMGVAEPKLAIPITDIKSAPPFEPKALAMLPALPAGVASVNTKPEIPSKISQESPTLPQLPQLQVEQKQVHPQANAPEVKTLPVSKAEVPTTNPVLPASHPSQPEPRIVMNKLMSQILAEPSPTSSPLQSTVSVSVVAKTPIFSAAAPLLAEPTQAQLSVEDSEMLVSIRAERHLSEPVLAQKATQRATPPAMEQVTTQLRQQITTSSRQVIEIRLDPPELGRVLIQLSTHDQGVAAQITADRPETLELMRRHSELLAASLEDAGFANSNLDFQNGDPDEKSAASDSSETWLTAAAPAEATQPTTSGLAADGRLDIRL